MTPAAFLPVLRELATAYQAFEGYSSAHIRTLDLTPAQFDIIATLGNTPGMPLNELGAKTLITKGTLTGVVDRLSGKQLVERSASPSDGRSQIVQLTPQGETLFERIFPAHLAHMQQAFAELSAEELVVMETSMRRLRDAFTAALTRSDKAP
ncbi:MarR family transcriptional regulator [Sulfurimicrobium lacus]|uniref:MarR family transcriptional regulator n=1 Tax=Sulfurimicrobium lacus TaxID=2715678 RepID=A0A6F8V9I6_9PROT|nr:MarR family transcriptional regulator [Sulfurimicrobium lacus]BCB26503.1 MarR family transcriptional regulator [Sulfurimicrobium lacus]